MLTCRLQSPVVGADRCSRREVAPRIDLPAPCDRLELAVEPPAIGARRALVFEARALQRHAARVLPDLADRSELLGADDGVGRDRRELGALVLDRPRAC